jgi:hypothetical protein
VRYAGVLRAASVAVPVLLIAVGVNAEARVTPPAAHTARVGQQPLTPALAGPLSRDVTDKVIIVLRNQFPGLPDTLADSARRAMAVASTQSAVLRELTMTRARDVKPVTLINAIAATVSPGEARRLTGNPAVAEVTPDLPIPLASAPAVKLSRSASGLNPVRGACPANKNGVQLDPEAVENIHAATQSGKNSARALGYTGAGVKVAFIADGLDPDNPDFIRASGRHVFVDYQDFSGTGTNAPTDGGEAFLDASSIAAQGRHVYNVGRYVGLSKPCRIRILGVAPGASLVGLNVLGSSFALYFSVFLEAINYAVAVDHVNVLNESFGRNPFPDAATLDLTKQADNAAVKAGVTVTVASGDAGPTSTIASPASDPNVISAGATTTYRAYAQTAFRLLGTPGAARIRGWIDNNISGISSGGFNQAGGTVDVVAPGDLNWALCTPKQNKFFACGNLPFELEGGTSEAAPLTAGVAALVIQAYRKGHHGRTPSPTVVKKIIVSTAQDIGSPADLQGAGMIDAYQAVLAARSYPGEGATKTKAGHAILDSATQLNAVGPPSAREHFTEKLTNDGTRPVTVDLSSRTLSPYSTVVAKKLDLGFSSAAIVKFRVAKGQARLNVSVALPGFVAMSLIAPDGDLAEYNLPQGAGNYANDQVAHPAPGTWTASIMASVNENAAETSAFFLAQTATWRRFGTLSTRSLRLPPGATRLFSLTVANPAQPGDQAGAIVLRQVAAAPAFTAVTTIPVTLRSLASFGTFSGTLTGGNGRNPSTGQTAYYQFDVNSALPALNATVSTANRHNTLLAELVSPTGVAASLATNELLETNSVGQPTPRLVRGAEVQVLHPPRGRWTLIVDFYNTVSGTAATQPFTVSLSGTAPSASQTGLPTSAKTKLTAGQAITADLTITNESALPANYFVDARLQPSISVKLTAQTTSSLSLPNTGGPVPVYLVPAHTTGLTATVTAPRRNFFDLTWPFGDPDLISTTGRTSKVNFIAPDVPNGDWAVTPYLRGPDGKKGDKPVQAHVTVKAVTAPIDPAISAPTGDLWLSSTNRNNSFAPYLVQPGQTITIPVTITPRGPAGAVVSGTIYLSAVCFNSSLVNDNGGGLPLYPTSNDLAAFHYRYTIRA